MHANPLDYIIDEDRRLNSSDYKTTRQCLFRFQFALFLAMLLLEPLQLQRPSRRMELPHNIVLGAALRQEGCLAKLWPINNQPLPPHKHAGPVFYYHNKCSHLFQTLLYFHHSFCH